MRSMTNYSAAKQAQIVRELLQKIKEEAKRKGRPSLPLMFTESYVHARNRIKKQIMSTEDDWREIPEKPEISYKLTNKWLFEYKITSFA